MNLVRIGGEIHHQRRQTGLPHEQVGTLAGLSRVTVNQLENGTLTDLGYTKLKSAMDIPDLNMENVQSKGLKSALDIAARSVGTSYRDVMTPELLATILRTGVAADRFQPHLMALLDETPFTGGGESGRRGGNTRGAREKDHAAAQPLGTTMESVQNGLVMAGALAYRGPGKPGSRMHYRCPAKSPSTTAPIRSGLLAAAPFSCEFWDNWYGWKPPSKSSPKKCGTGVTASRVVTSSTLR